MRIHVAILCGSLAIVGCKPKGGGGGGGGGGGWLVGSSGLMVNVDIKGTAGSGYELGSTQQLNGIACRYAGEAWVVGSSGTLLYTRDGGTSWTAQAVPVTGDLRAIATQDNGPVYVGGDGAFLVSADTGATWTQLGTGASFRSIAAAQHGATVLALGDGALWSYSGGALVRVRDFAGARAIAVSADGGIAMAAGNGLWRSEDAGVSWTQLAVDPGLTFDDVRVGENGTAVAVGNAGAIATIDVAGAISVQHVGTSNLHALHIPDVDATDATGYAAGDDGTVLVTHDSGASWTRGPNVGRTVWGVDEIGLGHR